MASDLQAPVVESTEKRSDIPHRGTPLIRNQWYVAALSHEVTRQPLQRTILDQDIVLYRDQAGTAVALQNRCAHRSYPLHLGTLNGDRIVCGYHGFEYGPDGRCAHLPALGGARPAIRIQPYPVIETGPFVWVWAGDAATVDYGKMVSQPWLTEPNWRYVSGCFHIKANYLGMHENLADLSHFPFLHTFAKGQVELARQRAKVDVLPDRVTSTIYMPDFPVSPAIRKVMQFGNSVSETSVTICETPAMQYGEATIVDSADVEKVMTQYLVHCLTPLSQTETHYFWAISRDTGLDSVEIDEELLAVGNLAFEEDRLALEEIELLIARDHRPDFSEKIVASDAGGMQILRLLARMADISPERPKSADLRRHQGL